MADKDITLTLGYFRNLTKDLPDDTQITECDYDESNLDCTTEQVVLDAQFVMFVPNKCYSVWADNDFDVDKPIPDGYRNDEDEPTEVNDTNG